MDAYCAINLRHGCLEVDSYFVYKNLISSCNENRLKNVTTRAYTVDLILFAHFDFREKRRNIFFQMTYVCGSVYIYIYIYIFARIRSSIQVEWFLTETVFVEVG